MPESVIEIRPLRSNVECAAAAALQRDVWGADYTDIVPASLLHVLDYVGGLAAGAFDASGDMVGFLFGVNGVRDGALVHWSHMLGVREAARNLGVGRKLKLFQRDALAALGVQRIFWTFDPLMAKNAYFNLNRLGARVVEYVPDMYGTSSSPLHLGLATDRVIVCLQASGGGAVAAEAPNAGAAVLTPYPRLDDHTVSVGDRSPATALIEMPGDVLDVLQRSPSSARNWRLAVRDHFRWVLSHGYTVDRVHRDPVSGRSFYVAVRSTPA